MKITLEEKKRIILEEHLRDHIPLSYLARKYNVSRNVLDDLKSRYMRHGEIVFERKYVVYSEEFKTNAVERVLKGGESPELVAFDLNTSSSNLTRRMREYSENNGKIENMKRGSKKKVTTISLDESKLTVSEKEELELLRAENAYLKKLISRVHGEKDES